jgi:hypothetical protein
MRRDRPPQDLTTPLDTSAYSETPLINENQFAILLGHAALKVWSDLPRDAQEQLFAAVGRRRAVANDLAAFLRLSSEDCASAEADAQERPMSRRRWRPPGPGVSASNGQPPQ